LPIFKLPDLPALKIHNYDFKVLVSASTSSGVDLKFENSELRKFENL
jgi:hypothetical protein